MSKIIKINKEADLKKIILPEIKQDSDVAKTVSDIIAKVRKEGDKALFSLTEKFDKNKLTKKSIKFSQKEIEKAYNDTPKELVKALELSAERVWLYHKEQYPKDFVYSDAIGLKTGWKWYPLESVGLYVPGGKASYPSSVIMTGIPAKVADIKNIIVTVPCPNGEYNPAILAAAKIVGLKDIYKIGGAQAVAAMAYGTESVTQVNKIVGPGNQYVAEAKRQVFGSVGIDSIAGPSEILVLAEEKANAEWIAYDLLSQAEHDQDSRAILVTDSKKLADEVLAKVNNIIPKLERKDIAEKSWQDNARIYLVDNINDLGVRLTNLIAPEHLEIVCEDIDGLIKKITNAGAIFIGSYSTEAIGDYIAGPSHVLPTSGTARFSSGLSIYDFVRKSSIINVSSDAFNKISDSVSVFAESEGLECHAKAVTIRKS